MSLLDVGLVVSLTSSDEKIGLLVERLEGRNGLAFELIIVDDEEEGGGGGGGGLVEKI